MLIEAEHNLARHFAALDERPRGLRVALMFATRYVRKRDAGRGGAARFAKDLRVTKVSLLALAASYTVLINYPEVSCGRNLDAFRSQRVSRQNYSSCFAV